MSNSGGGGVSIRRRITKAVEDVTGMDLDEAIDEGSEDFFAEQLDPIMRGTEPSKNKFIAVLFWLIRLPVELVAKAPPSLRPFIAAPTAGLLTRIFFGKAFKDDPSTQSFVRSLTHNTLLALLRKAADVADDAGREGAMLAEIDRLTATRSASGTLAARTPWDQKIHQAVLRNKKQMLLCIVAQNELDRRTAGRSSSSEGGGRRNQGDKQKRPSQTEVVFDTIEFFEERGDEPCTHCNPYENAATPAAEEEADMATHTASTSPKGAAPAHTTATPAAAPATEVVKRNIIPNWSGLVSSDGLWLAQVYRSSEDNPDYANEIEKIPPAQWDPLASSIVILSLNNQPDASLHTDGDLRKLTMAQMLYLNGLTRLDPECKRVVRAQVMASGGKLEVKTQLQEIAEKGWGMVKHNKYYVIGAGLVGMVLAALLIYGICWVALDILSIFLPHKK